MGKVRVCIMRIEGTNREGDAQAAFLAAGADVAELVHLKQLIKDPTVPTAEHRNLSDYDILLIPGGFSAGDAVRSGAIWAARMRSTLRDELIEFIDSGRPVVGICNGFQVLVELGALPGFSGTVPDVPEAALMTNAIGRFQCRPVTLKKVNQGRCLWTTRMESDLFVVPIAHGEGRFGFAPQDETDYVQRLINNDQIVFKYVRPDGSPADGEFPHNPNGSLADIAGICNPAGNVLGMMPHPENVISPYTTPDWTRNERSGFGLGLFKSAVEYARTM